MLPLKVCLIFSLVVLALVLHTDAQCNCSLSDLKNKNEKSEKQGQAEEEKEDAETSEEEAAEPDDSEGPLSVEESKAHQKSKKLLHKLIGSARHNKKSHSVHPTKRSASCKC